MEYRNKRKSHISLEIRSEAQKEQKKTSRISCRLDIMRINLDESEEEKDESNRLM